MEEGANYRRRINRRRRRLNPWDTRELIEGLESRVLLSGTHDAALLAAIDSALTSSSGLTAFNSDLKGSTALGTNVAVVGSGMSAYDPGAALSPLLSRLGSTAYQSISSLVTALQNGTGITVLSSSNLLNNIELNAQFTTTTNVNVPLNPNYGVTLLDPKTLVMPTTLTENLTFGAYWDSTIAPSGSAVFYVNADDSTIQVSSNVSSIVAPSSLSVPASNSPSQQITVTGAQAGDYILSINSGSQPTVMLDGVTIKTTAVGGVYSTQVETLTAGTHTLTMTTAPLAGTVTGASFIPQSGAELGFLQTSGGVTAVNFSPTFNFVLNDQPPVDSMESAGRLTLSQLTATPLATLVSTQVTQASAATVTASLSTPVAPGANPIVFTWSNVLTPASVASTLTTDPTLTQLNEFQAVNPTSLALGLEEVTGDFDAAATTTAVSPANPFDTPLPLLGKSLNQLVDFTPTTGTGGTGSIFQTALTDFTNPVLVGTGDAIDPFSTDQQLIALIQSAGSNTLTESASGSQLLFSLNMSIGFASVALPFAGLGSVSPLLNMTIPTQVSPTFTSSGTVNVSMKFGEDTSTGNFFVSASSSPTVTVNLTAAASLNTYLTNPTPATEYPIELGALAVDVVGGTLQLSSQATITLTDPKTDNPATPGIITANELISGTQPSGTSVPVPATNAMSGTAAVSLPISVDTTKTGGNTLGIAPATISISWPNISTPATDTFNTSSLGSYLAWNNVTPASLSNGVGELKSALNDLSSSYGLGQVVGLFGANLGSGEKLISDVSPPPAVPNFQTPSLAAGTFMQDPVGGSEPWGFYNGNSGISTANSGLTTGTSNQPTAQVGYIIGGAQITTGIPNWDAGTYTLTVSAAQAVGNAIANNIQVLINNTVVGTISPTNTTYTNYSLTFAVPTGGTNSLTFQGTGGNTVLFSAPGIVTVSSQPAFADVQSMYAFFARVLGTSDVTLTGSASSAVFGLDISQSFSGSLPWAVEHPVAATADFSTSGSVPATATYTANIPLGISLSSTPSTADPFYISGGTDFSGTVVVNQTALSGSGMLGNLAVTYAGGSLTANTPFTLPLGTSGQKIPISTLLSLPQSYFGKLAFTSGAAITLPITGGLPSPGTSPKLTFNWTNLGQASSLTDTNSNLGNISSATTYNDQGFLGGINALNTEIGTWLTLPQMMISLPWIDKTVDQVIPFVGDFQSVFTQIGKLQPTSAANLDSDITTLALPSGGTITATSGDVPASNDFEYTLNFTFTNQAINFPFALGAGYDSLLSLSGTTVHVTANFAGSLTFGFKPVDGFYVDGYSGSGAPQMSMTVNIGGTSGQSLTAESAGKFGNLPMGVGTAGNPAVISLNATSALNLIAPGDNGLMTSTMDLEQGGPALAQPTVAGSGSMTLPFGLQLGGTASVYQANAGPGIISIFYSNWNPTWAQPLQFYNPATGSPDLTTVNSQDPTNPTNAAAGFGNIYFDTGEFLTDMVGPYLKDIEQFNPLPSQITSALSYKIPVIDMTPLDLLQNYLGGDSSDDGDGVDTLFQIVSVISQIQAETGSTEQLDLSQYLAGAPSTGDAGMIDGGLDSDASGFQSSLTSLASYGITLPVFSDPHSAIAQTLLNVPTTLIEFKPGNNGYISYTASYNTPPITFPVFDLGVLSANATFSAGISATLFGNIDIGLTTRGLLGQGIGSGGTQTHTPNLLDGFFIGDNTFGGDGTPYQMGLKFEGYVTIGGEIALGGVVSIASISGSLGPEGTLGVMVNDLTYTQTVNGPIPTGIANYNGDAAGDGKAYLDELTYIASTYGPLCAVMPVASVGLNLSINATVGDPPLGFTFNVYNHDFVIANWNVPCVPTVATLATVSGNTLTINPNIGAELLSTTDGPNNISAGVWYNSTTGLAQGITITESNQSQIYSQNLSFSQLTGVNTLVINGTEGDDTFNFDPSLTEPNFSSTNQQTSSTIQIQNLNINTLNGNDTADLSSFTNQNSNLLGLTIIGGEGTDHFEGNYCPDLIQLGSGANFAYIGTGNGEVIEGAGVDAITGGDGNDTVIGGNGASSISLGNGNNVIREGPGQAKIDLGNGQNLITPSSTVYNSGISTSGSTFTSGNPATAYGNQVAFIQGNSAIAQATNEWLATDSSGNNREYEITFYAAQRATGNNGGEDFEVFLDNKSLGIFDPSSTAWQLFTTSVFSVTAGPHLITFRGLDTAGGNNMAFIDNANVLTNGGIMGPVVVPTGQGGLFDPSFESTALSAGTYSGNDIVPPSDYLNEVSDFSNAIPEGQWTYIAGIGTDSIAVGDGQNTISGDLGGSIIKVGKGQDIIYAAGAGTDSITGGGGNDFVSINLDESPALQIPAVQGTPAVPLFTVDGGTGNTLLDVQGNGSLTLNNASVILGPSSNPISKVQFSDISSVALSGGGAAVSFDVSQWTGTSVQLAGGGGVATIVSTDNTNFTLSDSSLTRSDGTSFALRGITVADLTGGASNSSFDVTGWHGTGIITGNGGSDAIIAGDLTNPTLTNTLLQRGASSLQLVGIGQANLTTAPGGNATINASAFTGNVAIFGQGSNDTLTGGSGSNYIVGGAGTGNTLTGNGTTDNELIGGTGSGDKITGGAGENTLVSSVGGGDTITTGSGKSHVYTPGGNNTIHAENGNAVVYAGSSGNTVDTGTSTTDQILHSGDSGTVASDFTAPTTSDLWEFPANPVVPAATLPTGTTTLGQWVQFGASASGGGLSSSPAAAIDPDIIATGSGATATEYAAWADNRDGNYQIYVAAHSSSGWTQLAGSAQGGGISNGNSDSLSPSIALDSAGYPVVAWTEAGNIDVAEFNPAGNGGLGAWVALGGSLSAAGISNTGDASAAQIVNIAAGPVVAWLDTSGGPANVFVRKFNGTNWVVDGTGSGSGQGVSGSATAVPGFSLATDGTNLSLAWTQTATSAGTSIYVQENTGTGGWKGLSGSATGTGISGSLAAEEPSVAFAGGSIYVAWAADTDGTNNIVAAADAGSGWQPLTIQTPISAGVNQVSRGVTSDPVLSANGSSLELAWIEDRLPGTPDQAVAIYADQLAGGAFVSQLPGDSSFDGILGRSTSLSQPATLSLAVDGAGHPFVVWGDSSSGSSQVYMLGDTLNITKIIYVNDNTGPDDSYTTAPGKPSGNTGLTPNSPLSSISAALALATSPGDVILVDSGTYAGFTVGAANAGVDIIGSPDGSTAITGAVSITGGSGLDLQWINFVSGLTISNSTGVELNTDVSANIAATVTGSSNVSFNNDGLFGVNFSGAASSSISLVNDDLTGTGLNISGPVTGLVASGNRISQISIGATSQGAISNNNIDGGLYGGGLLINAAFTGGISGNYIHGAVVGVTYNAAAALNGNQIFRNHTGIIVSQTSGGLGFLTGSTPNYIVNDGIGVKLLGVMQGQYIGNNDVGVIGSGVLGGTSLATANQIQGNATGINFTGTIQDNRIDENGTSFVVQNGQIIADNLIYDNGTNLETLGASNLEIVNNSIYSPSQDNIDVDGSSSDVEILNNILWTGGGYDINVNTNSRTGFFSDYNDLYTTGSGQIVFYLIPFSDILDWQDDVARFDLHSIGTTVVNPTGAQPRFVNLGFGDFNVFATAAGKRATSPTIGTGDPESDIALPPAQYVNSLSNPSFESGTTGWTVNTGGTTQSASPSAFDGSSYFYSGSVAAGSASQTISLASDAAAIDAGTLDVSFGGRIRSALESIADQGQLVLTFLDGSGNVIGTPTVISASNTTDRWELVGSRVHIPIGARSVTYRFQTVRESGSTDDSYLDAAFVYVLASNVAADIGAEGAGDTAEEEGVDEKIQLQSPDLYVNWTANQSHQIQWTTFGNAGDTPVRIDVYQQTGGVLTLLDNITPSTADTGSYAWIPQSSGLTAGNYFNLKIEVTLVGEPAIQDISTETFSVVVPGSTLYVNDGSTAGDQYSTAAGNNRNTGLSASSPLPLLTTLFRTYALGAGNIVDVDTGTYNDFAALELSGNPAIGNGQGVDIAGPTNGQAATINSLGFTSPAVIDVNDAGFVTLSNLTLSDANYGVWVHGASSNFAASFLTLTNNLDGGLRIESDSSTNATLNGIIADNNTGDGVYVGGAIVSLTHSTSYNNTGDGFDLTNAGSVVLTNDVAYGNVTGLYISDSISSTTPIIGNANLALALGNQFYNNSKYGIDVESSPVLLAGNTVYGQTASGYAGIQLNNASGTATENIVYGNYDGIRANANNTSLTDNLVYNNPDVGLEGGVGTSFVGNVSYNNGVGIRSVIASNAAGSVATISNNLVYDNTLQGIWLTGGNDTTIYNNTVYQLVGDAILADSEGEPAAAGIQIENNILWTQSGYDISLDHTSENGFKSDYNDLYFTVAGEAGLWEGVPQATLGAWQATSGRDIDSISVKPAFVNPGVDFHEQSKTGSFHGGTLAPVLNGTTGLPQANPGVLTADANESPAIDRGDPTFSYANEPAPNGGFINLGAYGNTAQASLSPASFVQVLQPTAGQALLEQQTFNITWRSQDMSGTVNIELLQSGTPVLAIASGVPNSGSDAWSIPTSLTPGSAYTISVTRNSNAATGVSSIFTIDGAATKFYVNGNSTGGIFTTAGGSDANSGLDSAHPKATIQALLAAYQLGAGDIIYVDEGTYNLSSNIVLTSANSGLTIEGVNTSTNGTGPQTILNRDNTTSISYAFDVQDAANVTIENFTIGGGYYGVNAGYVNGSSSTNLTVTGSTFFGEQSTGVFLANNNSTSYIQTGDVIANNVFHASAAAPTAPSIGTVSVTNQGNLQYVVSGWGTGSYAVQLNAAQAVSGNNGGENFEVLLDGTVVATINPTSTSYLQYTSNEFTVTSGSHTIELLGLDTAGGSNTAMVQSLAITSPPSFTYGIQTTGDQLTISGNVAYGLTYGIYANSSDGSTVSGNTTYNDGTGLYAVSATVSGNISYNNTNGITLTGNTASGNTTYGNSGVGINLYSGTASGNISYGNAYGIDFNGTATASDNLIYNNTTAGIYGANGATILGNTLYGNKLGITISSYPSGALGGPVIENNLLYNNITGGIYMIGGDNTPIINNTIYQTAGIGLQLVSAGGGLTANNIQIRNNIIWDTAGADITVDPAIETNVATDYNDFYFTGSGEVGIWGSTTAPNLAAWQTASQQDPDSISTDPLFVSTGVDFHEQSLNGSYHGGTLAPILNTTTGLPQANPGTLTDDANESPAIDRGSPSDPYSAEPTPNGAYDNLGAYGDSSQASLSPAHYLFITNPAAGLSAATGQTLTVKWRDEVSNTSTGASDTDTLQLITGGNVALSVSVPDNGSYVWTLPGSLVSGAYQVKVIRTDATGLTATSSVFNISAFNGIYYVNSSSTGGTFTTAGGSDSNSGLDPAHPKATIAAIFASYTLQPGNVIMVDQGTYSITNNIALTAADSGITIEGVAGKTILNRGTVASGAYVIDLQGALNLTLENLGITDAYYGINEAYGINSAGLTVTGCNFYGNQYMGIYLENGNTTAAENETITNNTFSDDIGPNGLYGFQSIYTEGLTFTGNTIYAGAGTISDGVYVSTASYGTYTDTISGNTVYGTSTGISASSSGQPFMVSNNVVYDNFTTNISVSGSNMTVSGNKVYEDGGAGANESSSETGISAGNGPVVSGNTVYANVYGINGANATASGNRVYDNSKDGIYFTSSPSQVTGNDVYSNGMWGIQFTGGGGNTVISNNLIYANTLGGIYVSNPSSMQVANNTIYQTTGTAFQVDGTASYIEGSFNLAVNLQNNILWATSGPDIMVSDGIAEGFTSDYNDLYFTGTGYVAELAGVNFTTTASGTSLQNWAWELGQDTHSISVDPQFVNTAGADGILGYTGAIYTGTDHGADDNFHLQSTSSAIDAGNPTSIFFNEPAPNGGRINLGNFGNTAQADPSPAAQSVQITTPANIQKLEAGHQYTLSWQTAGVAAYQPTLDIDSGGNGVGYFAPDSYRTTSNSEITVTNTIDTSGVTNPAPQAVYQSFVYSNSEIAYQLPVANGNYTLRLDFMDDVGFIGDPVINIKVNGVVVQSGYNLFATAGASFKATALSYNVTASGGTGLFVEVVSASGYAPLCGLELSAANPAPVSSPTANLQISTDNGADWTTIATNQPLDVNGRGSYLWTAGPQTTGQTALFRVSINSTSLVATSQLFSINNGGTSYYVNDSSTTGDQYTTAIGNNANSGKTPNAPMASIEAVISDYHPGAGDTIYVDNGSYTLFHNIDIPLIDSGLTIEGPTAPGTAAVINRNNSSTSLDFAFSLFNDGTNNVTIEDLSITGAYIGVNASYAATSSAIGINAITIANNLIYSNSDEGILTGYNFNWNVTGNTIHNNGNYGIYLQGTTANITDNTVYNEPNDGIFFSTPVYGTTAAANVVSGNTVYGDGTGISVDQATVSGNFAHDNTSNGIYADDGSVVTGNTVWRQTGTNAAGINVGAATVNSNDVYGNYNGIIGGGSGSLIVNGNRIYSNTNYGLLVENASGSFPTYVQRVSDNLIYANSKGGVYITGSSSSLTVINNTVYQLVGDAIDITSQAGFTLENNILWVQAGYDLDIASNSQSGFVSDYNILYHIGASANAGFWNSTAQNTLAAWHSASSQDSHSSEANPNFVDPAGADAVLGYNASAQNGNGYDGGSDDNFFVTAGSPAIAAGNHSVAPATDLLGYPLSAVPDLGAYAYRGIPADSAPPTVASFNPGASQITVLFSQTPNDIDAGASSLYVLRSAGPDGIFGTSDDVIYTITPTYQTGTNQVTLSINGGPVPPGLYQLTILSNSSASVHNLAGVALDGNNDGAPGGNYVTTFTISAPIDTINGTGGNDAITLTRDPDGADIDWTLGATSGKLAISDPNGLTINGNGGSDTINLNYTKGNPLPNTLHLNGLFTIAGLTGSNPLAGTSLEIGSSTVYISYGGGPDPLSLIQGYLKNGYNGGAWTGAPTATTGVITSIPAVQNVSQTTGIGYVDSADGLITGQPANTIELKYTLYGDTGLTGAVGFTDFMRMTQHYTRTGATWDQGDFNYDGSVNSADFSLLQPNYGTSLASNIALDTITGASGVDNITLTEDADHQHIDWTLNGNPQVYQLAINDANGLTINGNGGNDVITLKYTNGNPLPGILHLNGTFTINGLSGTNPLAGTILDLEKSTLYISYANAASDPRSLIQGYLKNGYNGAAWTGVATASTGAINSAAAAANGKTTGIGYVDSADGLIAGQPANTIELKYTLYGDTGLTGTVGFTDFMRMTQHYTRTGATWDQGDFNYDGSVNAADFALLQPNYGQTLSAQSVAPAISTPAPSASPAPSVTLPPPASALAGSTNSSPPKGATSLTINVSGGTTMTTAASDSTPKKKPAKGGKSKMISLTTVAKNKRKSGT